MWKCRNIYWCLFSLERNIKVTTHYLDNKQSKVGTTWLGELSNCIHCVAKVYAVLPFYDVKCLCYGGREWGRKATPTKGGFFSERADAFVISSNKKT